MADSIREQIIAALVTKIGTAIGIPCLRVPRVQRDYEGASLLGLVDEEDVPEKVEYGSVHKVMRVSVQYVLSFPQSSQNESQVANAMLAEVEAGTTSGDRTLGGLCSDVRYVAGSPAYDAETPTDFAAVVAAFEVRYQTDLGDPFTNSYSV